MIIGDITVPSTSLDGFLLNLLTAFIRVLALKEATRSDGRKVQLLCGVGTAFCESKRQC